MDVPLLMMTKKGVYHLFFMSKHTKIWYEDI